MTQKQKKITSIVVFSVTVIVCIVLRFIAYNGDHGYFIEDINYDSSFRNTTGDAVLKYCKINRGDNMFDLDAKETCNKVISNIPQVKKIEIVKKMPGTINMSLVLRQPVAKIKSSPFVCDESGIVFAPSLEQRVTMRQNKLPDIYDEDSIKDITPGSSIKNGGLKALEIINEYNKITNPIFKILNIKTDNKTYLKMNISFNKEICLDWDELDSATNIENALNLVTEALQSSHITSKRRLIVFIKEKRVHGI